MMETPEIVQTQQRLTAAIRFTIPRDQIQTVMGPAIGEVMAAVAQQGIGPDGPVFSRHFRMDPEVFDFEVGVPVRSAVEPVGRVRPSSLPAAKVVRTVYQGPYEGLGAAWGELCEWAQAHDHPTADDLWEYYVAGPETDPNPATFRTELNRPIR
ncbi:MAG: AraC family transcriptional regulator [Acidobacteria bacterium]|nr:AraC family transcriptional regulator [Acidobacteriota bacterium]